MARDILEFVRGENPVPNPPRVADADGLLTRILAGPADPRLLSRSDDRTSVRRPRTFVLLACSALVLIGTVLARSVWRVDREPPRRAAHAGAPVEDSALAGVSRRVTTVAVPGRGQVEIWAADGPHGASCLGARLPGGTWVGVDAPAASGSIPGCSPDQASSDDGPARSGIDSREATFLRSATRDTPPVYRVWYGTVDAKLPGLAVRVEDRATGAVAAVHDGKYWALVVRNPDGTGMDPVAYDADGNVLHTASASPRPKRPIRRLAYRRTGLP